jgi:hypothetical protein
LLAQLDAPIIFSEIWGILDTGQEPLDSDDVPTGILILRQNRVLSAEKKEKLYE